jgi:ligand-binding SRPBCC domain-containing protein
MADYILESRVWLARARPEVFEFFAAAENLVLLAPPSFRLAIVSAPRTLSTSAVIDLRMSWLGVPLTWRAFIREWDPPHRFVDVQVRGPYARWEHRHRFLEERGGTWVEDRITYRLPLGPLGRAAHVVLVRRQIAAMWRYRTQRLGELIGPVSSAPAG